MSLSPQHIEDHPSPHRDRVNLVVLLAGLAASPFGWALQLIAAYGVSSWACFPNDAPHEWPTWSGERPVLLALNLICFAVVAAGGLASLAAWRRSRDEKAGGGRDLIEVGEGRTRFLAGCGILLALGFGAATLFNTASVLWMPTCWRLAP